MGTWHADAADGAAEIALKEPGGEWLMGQARSAIASGEWDSDYVDPLGQPERVGWSNGQLWTMVQLHSITRDGRLPRIRIPVGETPHSDRQRRENAAALSLIPDKYTVDLDLSQNGADCDGFLRWHEDIELISPGRPKLRIAPGCVPLEVGTTLASRTFQHIKQSGGLARWPYGHDYITLLVELPEEGSRNAGLNIEKVTDADVERAALEAEAKRAIALLRENDMSMTAFFLRRAMECFDQF